VETSRQPVDRWLFPRPEGLYCAAGGFYIDPSRPVARAVITHGHSDHARRGHGHVLATAETLSIMRIRLGDDHAGATQVMRFGEVLRIGDVDLSFHPAGHVLGSAQICLSHAGRKVVVSGDYKRARDPTCAPFEVQRCDLFVTEATFGLPVFRHEPAASEVNRLLSSLEQRTGRTHLLGVYGLGKCQRMLALVREAGYKAPVYLHGALYNMTEFYQSLGFDFGELRSASEAPENDLAGALVMCPPSALTDRWSRRFGDPVRAAASGWMRVRARARQRGADLPLIVSDHADWPELLQTIGETQAEEIWVTHGREDALLHQIGKMGLNGRALSLVGFEDEAD
jgi:putative mRNA 3-end processing factor